MEPPWDGGMEIYSNGRSHMTNVIAMPIYGKNLKKVFSGTKRPMTLKLGMHDQVLEHYQVCINDDAGLTLTYFMARSNGPLCFCMKKGKQYSVLTILITLDFYLKSLRTIQ